VVGLSLGLIVAGCGGAAAGTAPGAAGNDTPDGDAPEAGPGVTPGGDYYPLAVGATWTYRISNAAGMMADKTTTIEAMEPSAANGPAAFRIRNAALASGTVNWEQLGDASAVVRYRQQMLDANGALLLEKTYKPGSVVVDQSPSHLMAGATWGETFVETKPGASGVLKASQEFVKWTVEATDDVVSVPAGMFTCIRVRRHHTSSNNPADEVTWYAPGTGRVKETGGGPQSDETRELVSSSLP